MKSRSRECGEIILQAATVINGRTLTASLYLRRFAESGCEAMTAQRIVPPATAFSRASRKQPREESGARKFEDLSGQRFGRLVALEYRGRSGTNAAWLVRCDCGTQKIIKSTNLKRQQSCGCLLREQTSKRFSTHGLTRVGQHHPLYDVWNGMVRRCHSDDGHERYRGRGIIVCDRWRFGADGKTAFECFLADMGPRPSKSHSIDRKNNDGPYSSENCRWATAIEQQRNRSSNRRVIFNGAEMTLTEAIHLSGLRKGTVWGRLHIGWSMEAALTTPVKRRSHAA